ncbi:MAG: ArnT family glycosyltransferase, partial [Anaerolineae bacterium]
RYQVHLWGWMPLSHPGPDLASTLATVRDYPLDFIQAVRLPMALAASLVIAVIFVLLRRLLPERLALLAALVLAFDPFLLAHTRIIHVDAPLAYFMFAAFIAFLLYLDRGGWPWLILSGLMGALGALSKTPGAILAPILLASGLLYALLPPPGVERRPRLKRLALALGVWGLIAAAAFFALWPSMWARPAFALTWIINNIRSVNSTSHPTSGVFWGPTGSDRNPLYYLFVLPFHLTPLSTVGLLAGLAAVVAAGVQRRRGQDSFLARHLPLLLSLLAYAIVFVAPVSYVSRRGDRYILPVYLAVDLLAVLGLWWLASLIGGSGWTFRTGFEKLREFLPPQRGGLRGRETSVIPQGQSRKSRNIFSLIATRFARGGQTQHFAWLFLALIVQIAFVLLYHPYYFDYFNPLAGGYRTAPQVINVGWGEGLDQAARYLNQVSANGQKAVAAWYSWQFAPYYRGETLDLSSIEPALTADYTVFYINQVQRGFPSRELLDYFADRRPEKVITLGGAEYAWIYPGPIVSTDPPAALGHPTDVTFGGAVHLYGLELAPAADALAADGELAVTLFWQALAPIPRKLNVAVRLLDGQGVVWGDTNRFPIGGLWYTHQWQPGVFIRDEYKLSLQPGAPPGQYSLEVELYDVDTLETFGLARNVAAVTVVEPDAPVTPAHLDPALRIARTALGDGLNLVGYDLEDRSLLPGQGQAVKLFWQATGRAGGDYRVEISARPKDGAGQAWVLQRAVLADLPPRQVRAEAYLLSFPPEAPAGEYELQITLIADRSGQAAGAPVTLGTWRLQDRPHNYTLPSEAIPVSVVLNDEIELIGLRLEATAVDSGQDIPLTLYWRARQTIPAGYTVFVHAVGPDGVLRGQWDSVPGGGALPTTGWLPGEVIADSYRVPMAEGAPAWKYDIYAGLYDSASGQRLPVKSETLPVSDNRIFLGQVQVRP